MKQRNCLCKIKFYFSKNKHKIAVAYQKKKKNSLIFRSFTLVLKIYANIKCYNKCVILLFQKKSIIECCCWRQQEKCEIFSNELHFVSNWEIILQSKNIFKVLKSKCADECPWKVPKKCNALCVYAVNIWKVVKMNK